MLGSPNFTFTDIETGTTQEITPSAATFTSNSSLCFFGCKSNNVVDKRRLSGKLFSAEIQEYGKTKLIYTPARSPSGEVGLYVSNGTFLKANNDGFQAGPEVGYIENAAWKKGTKTFIKTADGWKQIQNAYVKGESSWIKG